MSTNVKDRLATLKTQISKTPHIKVDTDICDQGCPHQCTTFVCPARCYEIVDQKMRFQYEDCIECGTCFYACDQGAVKWNYPESGHGVSFKLG
jgi:ferredoxin like protein